jgi:hypothetical protein
MPSFLHNFREVLLDLRYLASLGYRLFRSPRQLQQEWHVWCDYLLFRRSAKGILDRKDEKSAERGEIFAASLSGSVYSAKLEGMLLKGLALRGYTPIVLTSRYAYWARHYLRIFGVTRFYYIEDIALSKSEKTSAQEQCDAFVRGPISLQICKSWLFEGAPIGQYAVSTVARTLHRGMPDFLSPIVRDMIAQQVLHCIHGVYRAKKLFERIHPAVCLFNEINYSDYGPVYAVAYQQGLNVVQFVHALRDSALIFKRSVPETYRIAPNSISRTEMKRLESLPWLPIHEQQLQSEFNDRYGGKSFFVKRDQNGKRMKTREAIFTELGLDPKKKVAVVFSHVLWDANLFYGDDLFEDNEHWFIETLRAACVNDQVNWIIRLHPAIIWKREWDCDTSELNELAVIREQFGTLPPHVRLLLPENDINSYSLFQVADYGVTIRGTVGIELPCMGIPVLTAGTGRYSGLGFTVDSDTRDEYLEKLRNIQNLKTLTMRQTELAKKHAYAIFCLRPWVMKAFSNMYDVNIKGVHPLNPMLTLRLSSYDELCEAEDLRKFSDWALDPSHLDYLEPWSLSIDDSHGRSPKDGHILENLGFSP